MKNRELSEALTEFPARFMEPVYIGDPPLCNSEPVCASGTATLVRLGDHYYAITCQHVLAKYRELRGEPRHFQIGHLALDPEAQLRSEDKRLDLAVIEIHCQQLDPRRDIGIEERKFFVPSTWPPDPTTDEDVLSLAGFPGVWREHAGENRLQMFIFSLGATGVHAASKTQLVTRIEEEKCESLLSEKELTDMGGMSGGPVFRWRRGDLAPQLVGVVYEYQAAYDLLFIRSTSVLESDGEIDHGAV